jgi:hypothetical protein
VNNKTIGGILAVVGVVIGVVGFVVWGHLGFSSKKLDAAVAVGVIALIVGVVMAVMPAKTGSAA